MSARPLSATSLPVPTFLSEKLAPLATRPTTSPASGVTLPAVMTVATVVASYTLLATAAPEGTSASVEMLPTVPLAVPSNW